ncbi:cytochrome C [Cupriavidus sp. USMAHM13]|uniref:cytochrome c n=1 Tax=Cupriavidus sp. USMAHM13 TaxID=1389192 RepID=UPI0008A702B9|nr:cytochrome c [Cupriavidus sp. USMAHM13]AOZ03665.1 cytochrome C [Cupriavidus sp. USMAHM13]
MNAWITRTLGLLGCALALLGSPAGAAGKAGKAGKAHEAHQAHKAQSAATATLTIVADTQRRSWTRRELLRDRRLASITVDDDNLKRRMTVRAIPLAALLEGLPVAPDASATTAASDGYVSHLPMRLLLADGAGEPRAWLAVEDPAAPWPRLKGHDIGPFRLVWTTPTPQAAAQVNESLWTYAIVRIDLAAAPAERFAAIRPAPGLPADGPVMRGFATFQRVCFSCHSLNRAGDANLGPDLNVPYNPVEYLGDDKLARLIRNPQALRWWPNSRMSAIDEKTLPDADLQDLLAYLHHMAGRKAEAAAPAN